MDYELSDSSGTDDDLPPSHQKRFQRGSRPASNGRSAIAGSTPLPRMQHDMEKQIHHVEQEAYSSVLRAFKAQSDAITWEKESLITELRKELRVSDEEHRELLSKVNADDIIRRIREWRKAKGLQPGMPSIPHPVRDPAASPTVSVSRKKPKTSHSVASLSLGASSLALQPSVQPPSSAPMPGPKSKKTKSVSTNHSGRPQVANRVSLGNIAVTRPVEAAYDTLIGRKVWTRWPEDNHFYAAVITEYNPIEISPEDIRGESDQIGVLHKGGRPGPGRGVKKSVTCGGSLLGSGRGRGAVKGQCKKDLRLPHNGMGKKPFGDIEVLHTETLIEAIEKVCCASRPDPMRIEKAKKVLSEHEQALVDAIAQLEDASDGESDNFN